MASVLMVRTKLPVPSDITVPMSVCVDPVGHESVNEMTEFGAKKLPVTIN